MKAYDFIIEKQVQWALNKGINLIGSKGERGKPIYTEKLEQNLFEPLRLEVVEFFNKGKGGELDGEPCKMQAVHSSSALAVNIFQYWMDNPSEIAVACELCEVNSKICQKIVFEGIFPIGKNFGTPPHIDVVIYNSDNFHIKLFAIEIKFTEPYHSKWNINSKSHFSPQYFKNKDIWDEMSNLFELAKDINSQKKIFKYLNATQLIKHILGLKNKIGEKQNFRLLYLWYDAFGEEEKKHREELEEFAKIAKKDGIKFHSMTVQELIIKLAKRYRKEHLEYIKYLTERYL